MKIFLALICFVAMLVHSFFGYYLYVRGESVFEPDNMVVAIEKKAPAKVDKFEIFRKKSDRIADPAAKEQAKNAAFYEKPKDGLIKAEEKAMPVSQPTAVIAAPEVTPAVKAIASESTAKSEVAESGDSTAIAPTAEKAPSDKLAAPTAPLSPANETVVTAPAAPDAGQTSAKPALAQTPAPVKTQSAAHNLSAGGASAVKGSAAAEPEYLPFNTGWSGFLQVENAILTTVMFFLGFAVCCVKGRGPASRWVFGFNMIFWGTLAGAIMFFLPENTPLSIFKFKFTFPQWYFTIAIYGFASFLSFLLFLNAFRRPLDAPKKTKAAKDDQAEPALGEPSVSTKPEAAAAASAHDGASTASLAEAAPAEKKHRFSFGKKADELKTAAPIEKKAEAIEQPTPVKEIPVSDAVAETKRATNTDVMIPSMPEDTFKDKRPE